MSNIYPGGDTPITPNLGLTLIGTDEIVAENFILIDAFAGSAGAIQVNGAVVPSANFNDVAPAAPLGGTNVLWQHVGSSVSAYVVIPAAGVFPVTKAFGGAVLFRIDRPEIPECEETLTRPEWVDSVRAPVGSVVKRGAIPAATVLVGASSIYRIIPCTEEAAMLTIRQSESRPLFLVKLADAPLITAGDVSDEQDQDDEAPY